MPQLQLTITVGDNGDVNVNGPISNKIVCYGMLEMARDAIRAYVPRDSNGIIPIRTPILVPKDQQ